MSTRSVSKHQEMLSSASSLEIRSLALPRQGGGFPHPLGTQIHASQCLFSWIMKVSFGHQLIICNLLSPKRISTRKLESSRSITSPLFRSRWSDFSKQNRLWQQHLQSSSIAEPGGLKKVRKEDIVPSRLICSALFGNLTLRYQKTEEEYPIHQVNSADTKTSCLHITRNTHNSTITPTSSDQEIQYPSYWLTTRGQGPVISQHGRHLGCLASSPIPVIFLNPYQLIYKMLSASRSQLTIILT